MEKEKLTKQIITVLTTLIQKQGNPTFKFPQGGAIARTLTKFISELETEFGKVTCERLVDACITGAYTCKNVKPTPIKSILSSATIKRMREQKRGVIFYQEQWLEMIGTSRRDLVDSINTRTEHPHSRYIFIPSEEMTKKRQLNRKAGYMLCQLSTLGWSPLSDACAQCVFVDECKQETEKKYPELYRLRTEYGTATD